MLMRANKRFVCQRASECVCVCKLALATYWRRVNLVTALLQTSGRASRYAKQTRTHGCRPSRRHAEHEHEHDKLLATSASAAGTERHSPGGSCDIDVDDIKLACATRRVVAQQPTRAFTIVPSNEAEHL